MRAGNGPVFFFMASLDRQDKSPAAYDPSEALPIVPVQSRSLFITVPAKI